MDDLHQDSHAKTGLPTEYFALCSEHFEASSFSRSVLIGTPVDFKRFYIEKGSAPSIYMKPKDSLDIDYKSIFPEKRSLDVSLGPYRETSVSKSPPPKKKNWFLFGLRRPIGDMLSIFRDDRSTPCPQEWAYFRVPSCSTDTCQAQTDNKFSTTIKIDIFRGQRNITGNNTSLPKNVYQS